MSRYNCSLDFLPNVLTESYIMKIVITIIRITTKDDMINIIDDGAIEIRATSKTE